MLPRSKKPTGGAGVNISREISTPTPLFWWLIANQAPNKLALTSTVSIRESINIVSIGINTGREQKGFDLAVSY